MLVRIVKLSFKEVCVEQFLTIFETNKRQIRGFNGCKYLELFQDKDTPSIFFTYSYWDSEIDLEHYRNSDLFKHIWPQTKVLFNAKPEAWSLHRLESLE